MKGFSECGLRRQSPIDLTKAISTSYLDLKFQGYSQVPESITIENNGHNIGWRFNNLSSIPVISGGGLPGTYNFDHIHMHWGSDSKKGSEHTVDGVAFPMEMHLVHYNTRYADVSSAVSSGEWDALAVLGFFFKISTADNPAFAEVVEADHHVHNAGSEYTLASVFTLESHFTNFSGNYYRYNGSLTTPTCNQIVVWTVMQEPIPISEQQIEAFRGLKDSHGKLLVDNFRPVQPMYGRDLYTFVH